MIKGIEHVAVVTTDVEEAAKFYTEKLGFRELRRLETDHSGTIIFVGLGGTEVELFEGGTPRPPSGQKDVGYSHICLIVDDVDAECDRLKGIGVALDMEPLSVEDGMRVAFFQDPFGNRIELMQRSE